MYVMFHDLILSYFLFQRHESRSFQMFNSRPKRQHRIFNFSSQHPLSIPSISNVSADYRQILDKFHIPYSFLEDAKLCHEQILNSCYSVLITRSPVQNTLPSPASLSQTPGRPLQTESSQNSKRLCNQNYLRKKKFAKFAIFLSLFSLSIRRQLIVAGCRKFLRCGPGCNVYLILIIVNTESTVKCMNYNIKLF